MVNNKGQWYIKDNLIMFVKEAWKCLDPYSVIFDGKELKNYQNGFFLKVFIITKIFN